jgi:hypothetical protein
MYERKRGVADMWVPPADLANHRQLSCHIRKKRAYQTIEGFNLYRFSIMEEALYQVL